MKANELLNVLKSVKPASNASALVPTMRGFVFSEDLVYCYSDSMALISKCDVGLVGVVPSALYGALAGNCCTLEVSQEDGDAVEVTAGRTSLTLPVDSLDAVAYKPGDYLDAQGTAEFTGEALEVFLSMLTECLPFAEDHTTAQGRGLSGVLITADGDLSMYATTMSMMVKCVSGIDCPNISDVSLAAGAATAITKLSGVNRIVLDDKKLFILVEADNVTLWAPLNDEADPSKLDGILDHAVPESMAKMPEDLPEVLKRCGAVLSAAETKFFDIEVTNDELVVSANTDAGTFSESVPFCLGEDVATKLSIDLFATALRSGSELGFKIPPGAYIKSERELFLSERVVACVRN